MRVLIATLILAQLHTVAATAQDSSLLPSISQTRLNGAPPVPYTAAQWRHALALSYTQALATIPPELTVFPKDSILGAQRLKAAEWLRGLEPSTINGIQLDPYGALLVVSGQEEQAKRVFAQRLVSEGMTLTDTAYTLTTAISAFANAEIPGGIQKAEEYMSQLELLPASIDRWKFSAHQTLAAAQYLAGDKAAVIRHAKRAFELLPQMFFRARGVMFENPGVPSFYLSFIDGLRGLPNAAEQIESINKLLTDATKPSSDEIARDSTVLWKADEFARSLNSILSLTAMLDKVAPPVRGTRWINVADTSDHEQPLNDGIVRIIVMGQIPAGHYALPRLWRLQTQFPSGFQSIFHMVTRGYWGKQFVSPEVETANLVRHMTVTYPTRVPVAIWAGAKEKTPDGGSRPAKSPTVLAFKAPRFITVAIVDKKGLIRRVYLKFGNDEEAEAAAVIKNLLAE